MANWGIIAARFFVFSPVLILFGSSLFYLYGFRRMPHEALYRRWAWPHITLLSASFVALLGAMGWLMAQTAMMTGAPSDAFQIPALWSVLSETTFGNVSALRLILLASSGITLVTLSPSKRLCSLGALSAGTVLVSLLLTGHGTMDEGTAGLIHRASDVLHLLAAGVWIGALVPLAILVILSHSKRNLIDAEVAYHGLDGFSGVGLLAVSVLVLTGIINSWFLIGPSYWREGFTTPYGIALLIKMGLFIGMLALAAANRFILTPRLNESIQRDKPLAETVSLLRSSVLLETGLAALVIMAVGVLGTLEPPVSGEP